MTNSNLKPWQRLLELALGLFRLPPGKHRLLFAFTYGIICHTIFGLSVLAMMIAMFFGMSESFGRVPHPWSYLANAVLILQFPLVHSVLLTMRGRHGLRVLAPKPYATTLATTTFAIIASLQLFALFALWTPSQVIWWRAEGSALIATCIAYAGAWILLIKASYDAGAEVQSGALGWMSLAQKKKPIYPDMPTNGLFRFIRQPIYLSFALTLWTVPVWTPDQLVLALSFTAYCLVAPRLKERRFARLYGDRFATYKAQVPYMLPRMRRRAREDLDPKRIE